MSVHASEVVAATSKSPQTPTQSLLLLPNVIIVFNARVQYKMALQISRVNFNVNVLTL